jgi:galactose mutarotase-like enzyme
MTDATLAVHTPAERRVSHDRHSFEFLFETLFRPGNWAAKLASDQRTLKLCTTTTENAVNLLSFRRIDRPSHHVAGVR